MTTDYEYTVVQHSGYGYADKPGFSNGLETRHIETAKQRKEILKAGGVVFPNYGAADDFCEKAMYPEGSGIYPNAKGTFSTYKVDGLAVYIPVREVVG